MSSEPSFHMLQPFNQDPRRLQPLKDAVAAGKEEADLEAVVAVIGGDRAQEAAHAHHLPELVAELNGHA